MYVLPSPISQHILNRVNSKKRLHKLFGNGKIAKHTENYIRFYSKQQPITVTVK